MVRTVRLAKAARQRSASPVSVALYPKKASSSPSRSDTSCVVASSYRTAFAALGLEGLITRSGESAPGLGLGLGLGARVRVGVRVTQALPLDELRIQSRLTLGQAAVQRARDPAVRLGLGVALGPRIVVDRMLFPLYKGSDVLCRPLEQLRILEPALQICGRALEPHAAFRVFRTGPLAGEAVA
eukprot:scaffold106241_cov65-Phaeocystis_antarctica.AAC.3